MTTTSTSWDPLPARLARGLEEAAWLEPYLQRAQGVADAVAGGPGRRALLTGRWMGHALHPALTDVPIGLWTASTVLDLVGGPEARGASRRLLGIGLLAAGPTAMTGWAEWAQAGNREKRVGVVHAALNASAVLLYAGSWAARGMRRHRTGVALGLAASGVAGAGAYLGGHLAIARKVGSRSSEFEDVAGDGAARRASGSMDRKKETEMTATGADVVAAVVAQHGRLTLLITDVRQSRGPARQEAFDALRAFLAHHEAAEEEIIHPAVEGRDGGEPVARQRETEERNAAQQVKRLETLDLDSPEFGIQFDLFEEAVTRHAEAEETEELPMLESAMTPEQADLALRVLDEVEQSGGAVTGNFATMLDDARMRFRALASTG